MAGPQIQPEQLYVVGVFDGKFVLSDSTYDQMPWHLLQRSFVYALSEDHLQFLLIDAATRGYMILDGAKSVHRGLRGFHVGIGPWGCAGKVECRTIDAWCLNEISHLTGGELVAAYQMELREVCRQINAEETTFRASALKWLSSLYHRLGRPSEPSGSFPPPLPPDVAKMARAAHIGGPIVHARSSLTPFVSLDRKRAYGEALLGDLPCGDPTEIDLGYRPLSRWGPKALMRAIGLAEATVQVEMGPLVPLLPVMQTSEEHVTRNKTLYPTGTMKGTWTLAELAYLEQSGRGHVEHMHRVVVFERGQPFRPIVRYLRKIEKRMPAVLFKRLEHMLYGKCARSLSVSRFSSARTDVRPMPSDILDAKTVERLTTRVQMHRYGLPSGHHAALPMYEVRGVLSEQAQQGTMDRPDRSAWITSSNRIEMCKILDILDEHLKPEQKGGYVGRIYVDGLDIEASPDQIPDIEGVTMKAHGPHMHLYRAGVHFAELSDGNTVLSTAGLINEGGSREDLERSLAMTPDPDGGPFAGGRSWKHLPGVEDPRMHPKQTSYPLHLDLAVLKAVGLS